MQSFGSFGFGLILDKWGVRTGLIINFIACACCYGLLSITDTIELLYLSRVRSKKTRGESDYSVCMMLCVWVRVSA
jgi:hypothetical protein